MDRVARYIANREVELEVEAILIPHLERVHGPSYRAVRDARQVLARHDEEEIRRLADAMESFYWHAQD